VKLFLLKDVPNFGKAGEIKEVQLGFARNFLIPKGLAVETTDQRAKKFLEDKLNHKRELDEEHKRQEEKVKLINGQKLTFIAKADKNNQLYGSIGPKEIAQKIGINENLIKEHYKKIGSYSLTINFLPGLSAQVEIEIKKEE